MKLRSIEVMMNRGVHGGHPSKYWLLPMLLHLTTIIVREIWQRCLIVQVLWRGSSGAPLPATSCACSRCAPTPPWSISLTDATISPIVWTPIWVRITRIIAPMMQSLTRVPFTASVRIPAVPWSTWLGRKTAGTRQITPASKLILRVSENVSWIVPRIRT